MHDAAEVVEDDAVLDGDGGRRLGRGQRSAVAQAKQVGVSDVLQRLTVWKNNQQSENKNTGRLRSVLGPQSTAHF